MKKRIIIASTILALFSISLCGCSNDEPAAPVSEPARSVLIAGGESEPESSSESSQITSPSTPEYPVQNETSYIVTITYYEDGEPRRTETEFRDEHDNLIKSSTQYGDYYYAYEYNYNGTVRVKYTPTGREEYEYDSYFDNRLETKRTTYDADGEVFTVTTHEYDEHGNATKHTHTLGEYLSVSTYKYEYDENGNWTKETAYNEDREVDGVSTRVYGENGEVLSGTMEETNALLTYEYRYDENGREVEHHSTQTRSGEVTRERRILTEYDEQGRISRKEEYRLDGGERLISTEEYNYSK